MSTYYTNNADDPNSPEYLKAWKPEFNHGCCPSCNEPLPSVCVTTTQAFTRSSQDPSLVTTVTNLYYCPCQGKGPISGCQPSPETINC